jgi:hypothetical protein
MRCRYCRAGLAGRLCARGHVNPVDTGLSFCGECGQPLERVTGSGSSPFVPILVLIGALITVSMLAALASSVALQAQLFGMLIIFVILVGGLRLAFGIVASRERNFVATLLKGFINLLLGTGNKGKK